MADRYVNNGKQHGKNKPSGNESVHLLTVIQITACAIILAAALLLKSYGGSIYTKAKEWYINAYNDTVLADEQAKNIKHTVTDLWSSAAGGSSAASEEASSSRQTPASKALGT